MIRFERIPEPAGFDESCRQPGNAWLAEHPEAKRPRDFWSPFRGRLADGFRGLCAWSAMHEPVGTVDHFVSWNENRMLAYEWSNFRFAAGWINSSKRNATGILDPFEVEDDWFEIILPSLQLIMTDRIPPEFRKRAEDTIERLHLRDDERVIRQRRSWMKMYEQGKLRLDVLREFAPLIARAIEKHRL